MVNGQNLYWGHALAALSKCSIYNQTEIDCVTEGVMSTPYMYTRTVYSIVLLPVGNLTTKLYLGIRNSLPAEFPRLTLQGGPHWAIHEKFTPQKIFYYIRYIIHTARNQVIKT